MAKDEIKRLKAAALKADEDAYTALKTIQGYKPANPDYALPLLENMHQAMTGNQDRELIAEKEWKSARDDANDAEWEFHNAVLGMKDQVIAQFGVDSNEVQLLGLKKKSEYKRPGRRKKD